MDIVDYLKNEIWFRVKPSKIHGVGLFAIRDIPKGTNIFVEYDGDSSRNVKVDLLFEIHQNIKTLIHDYFITQKINNNLCYYVTISDVWKWGQMYYMNHSNNPNVDGWTGITIKDIKESEELFEDYDSLTKKEEFK